MTSTQTAMERLRITLLVSVMAASVAPGVVADNYPQPENVTGSIRPVHDPSMAISADGVYLLFSTGIGIDIRTSTDRKEWTYAGAAFPKGLPWCHPYTDKKNPDMIWAPDIHYRPERLDAGLDPYVMYYACAGSVPDLGAIFHASSKTGKPGEWTHRGMVCESGPKFPEMTAYAIDPNLIVDVKSGQWWLDFGSFAAGIMMVKLNNETGLQQEKTQQLHNVAIRSKVWNAPIEAAYIYYNAHFDAYYLFVSWDYCCQAIRSNYRVMVGRSKNITGPYLDRDGVPMNEGGGTQVVASHPVDIHGPGHQAALWDSMKQEHLLVYHYYYVDKPWPEAKVGINVMKWDDKEFPYLV